MGIWRRRNNVEGPSSLVVEAVTSMSGVAKQSLDDVEALLTNIAITTALVLSFVIGHGGQAPYQRPLVFVVLNLNFGHFLVVFLVVFGHFWSFLV